MKSQKIKVLASAICLFAAVNVFAQEEKPKVNFEKRFKNLDKNKDNKLTKEELEGKPILKRFEKIDKNKDNIVTLEEFMQSVANASKTKKVKPKKEKNNEEGFGDVEEFNEDTSHESNFGGGFNDAEE